jgi:hypothetical protein
MPAAPAVPAARAGDLYVALEPTAPPIAGATPSDQPADGSPADQLTLF